SNYLYGKPASELDPEEKETISAITGLAGNAIGGTIGNGAADVVGGGQAARTAAENNSQLGEDLQAFLQRLADVGKDKTETPALKGFVQGLADVTNGVISLGDASLDTLASAIHCTVGGDYCADGMQYNREKGEVLIELGKKIGDGTIGRALIQWGEDLMSDDPARYNAAAEQLSRASTVLLAVTMPSRVAAGGKSPGIAAKGGTNAAEGVIASRINVRTGDANIKGSGLEYAWEKHGGTWGGNKSAFTISKDELKAVLQDPLVVKTPAYQSATSGSYIRIVDMGRTIGIDAKAGGQPTNFLTIITDSKGNLVNTFPGKTF
ncbi:MAG: VENN motif pre-toxin domain-containing protein, partial [Zoogloeaceae bacterium]|nr:VENN motif pre-toxin domain-containing protein [Zoogloeaceae bacterium]